MPSTMPSGVGWYAISLNHFGLSRRRKQAITNGTRVIIMHFNVEKITSIAVWLDRCYLFWLEVSVQAEVTTQLLPD